MSQTTLLFSGTYSIILAALYGFVGYQISRRKVAGDGALAQRMFLIWWYALAASSLLEGIRVLLYRSDALGDVLYAVIHHLNTLCILVALLGLLYYLVYLYTGSRRAIVYLAVFYVAVYMVTLWLNATTPIERVTDDGWVLTTDPPLFTDATLIMYLVAVIGPQFAAAIALLRLYFRVEGRTQKYRIALVSGAILVWFGQTFVAGIAGLAEYSWWPISTRIVGFTAALVILAAYLPPRWIQRRYGVVPIGMEEG